MSRSFISHVAAVFILLLWGDISLQAADPPTQSPTLERILKNWQARQDRTKSLHMAWDTKVSREGWVREAAARDAGFRMLHNELWMDGENRSRVEQSFTRGAGYQLTRFGKTEASYAWQFGSNQPLLADIWSAADPPRTRGRELNFEVDPRIATYSMRAPWILLRPLVTDSLDQRADGFHLVAENETVDNRHVVRLARTDSQTKTVEDFWVDPARGDVVVQWKCQPPRQAACTISLDFQLHSDSGWIPSRWTAKLGRGESPWMIAESTMTAFATDAVYPPDALRVTLPEGTVVFDRRTKEQYVIGNDGSRTNVSNFGSPKSLKIYEVLEMPVDFNIEPQPLTDALAFIAARYQINVVVDKLAFQRQGIDPTMEVSSSLPGLPARSLLWALLGELRKPVGFQIRDDALVIAPFSRKEAAKTKTAASGSERKAPAK
jgi:hypothetical protein